MLTFTVSSIRTSEPFDHHRPLVSDVDSRRECSSSVGALLGQVRGRRRLRDAAAWALVVGLRRLRGRHGCSCIASCDRSAPARLGRGVAAGLGPSGSLTMESLGVPFDCFRFASIRRPSQSPPTAVHDGSYTRRRHTALQAAGVQGPPHAYVKLWRHHAAQPRRPHQPNRRRTQVVAFATAGSSPQEFAIGRTTRGQRSIERWSLVRGSRLDRVAPCGRYVRNAAGVQGNSRRRVPVDRLLADSIPFETSL
jgi:hypothetical protein